MKKITILAFDPGIDFMGWSVLTLHPPKEKIIIKDSGTLEGKTYYKKHDLSLRKKFKRPFIILQSYKKVFKELIEKYNPDYVVSEGAFAHSFIAAAFSLITIIHVLRQVCFEVLCKDIEIIAPMQTKSILTGKNMADKEMIKVCINKNKNLALHKSCDLYTEHEYDSIGHGYAFIHMKILHPEKYPIKKKKIRKKK